MDIALFCIGNAYPVIDNSAKSQYYQLLVNSDRFTHQRQKSP
ncbi:hypothetical protein [Nostoc sp. DSM 114161]